MSTRREALDEFEALLGANAIEAKWQQFFAANPFVLTDTLPIGCARVYPHVKLDSGEPDFVFIDDAQLDSDLGFGGIIELKRPDNPIATVYAGRHLIPSSALQRAQRQAARYLEDLQKTRLKSKKYACVMSNAKMVFIIIGKEARLVNRCRTEILRQQIRNLLPAGFCVVPYDYLFNVFRRRALAGGPSLFVMEVHHGPVGPISLDEHIPKLRYKGHASGESDITMHQLTEALSRFTQGPGSGIETRVGGVRIAGCEESGIRADMCRLHDGVGRPKIIITRTICFDLRIQMEDLYGEFVVESYGREAERAVQECKDILHKRTVMERDE